jgi:hypothetical protein
MRAFAGPTGKGHCSELVCVVSQASDPGAGTYVEGKCMRTAETLGQDWNGIMAPCKR